MPRHTPTAFLLIVGLLFVDTAHAEELVSSSVKPASTQPRTFIIDFDSASLETRQAHGVDLDGAGLLEVRDIAAKALPGRRGIVKRSWLIVIDSATFEPGFFDGPILLELPTGLYCVAHPRRIEERQNGSTAWYGRCDSSVASGDSIALKIYPAKQVITGIISWGKRGFNIRSTHEKPFHIIFEYDRDYVYEKPLIFDQE